MILLCLIMIWDGWIVCVDWQVICVLCCIYEGSTYGRGWVHVFNYSREGVWRCIIDRDKWILC